MSSKLLALFKQPSRLTVLQRRSQHSLQTHDDNVHFFILRWHPTKKADRLRPLPGGPGGERGGFDEQAFADELHRVVHEELEEEEAWLFKIYAQKTYLDVDCISYLSVNRQAFSKERFVCNCTMFVPVITWGRVTSVLGLLEGIREEADREDDFLQLALAMIYLLEKKAGRARLVLPILRDEGGGHVSLREAVERLSGRGSGDVRRSAEEAGGMLKEHLVKELRAQIAGQVWHFEKHNPRGIEMLQVLRETKTYELLHEFFALRSIDSLDRLSAVSTMTSASRARACEDCEGTCEGINRAKEAFYDEAVKAIGEMVRGCAEDERFLPLNTRLRVYRDDDVDGILALRSSNALETALLKTPAQCCIAFAGITQLLFGAVMVQRMLEGHTIWMQFPETKEVLTPRTVQVSKVIDSFLSFLWGTLYLSAIVTCRFSTPLNAKRVLVGSGHLIVWLKIISSASDFIQCDVKDAVSWPGCSGLSSFILIACVSIVLYFVHFMQHYAWIVVFVLQGAYCIRDGLTIRENTKPMFVVLGVISWIIVIVIVVKYSLSYRQTYKDLSAAMEGFEKTWSKVVSSSTDKLEEISREVLEISQKLGAWSRREGGLWERVRSRAMGKRASRYSVRSKKIRQESKSLEKLFEEAHEVSAAFQLWVSGWNPVGRMEHGKVKSCERAIQKTVRSYHRDPSCLTDLVRCTVVVKSVEEVLEWVRQVRSMSAVAAGLSGPMSEEKDEAAGDVESGRGEGGDGVYLNITSIKNRYDRRYDLRACGGYRDLCICVEVGWTVNAKNGSCTFIPLKQWDETLNLRRHICEVQVLLEDMYTVKQHVHKEYVNFRNVLCQAHRGASPRASMAEEASRPLPLSFLPRHKYKTRASISGGGSVGQVLAAGPQGLSRH
ncbi:hypothetical protein GUITHDRAFT_109015 [Guillardia theta CCMP2712]|uniref:Uncharacterized protein n=1 Tax=Guillardia theta (strain CCMP2712) TaxID=905079 RepID=L1J9H8_GUITC|nr:hypothetical protein GUITHDRAFT_109015 [Guillardia theta CCMP2712]EKX44972.1 hypothetical protein GUITHDRAFT_109015 [Guillardia theta CCMP2712]|eukprot:XP_005831952.1 hypothetical protein GUITHDRAFT_109015 [Guillardia theta CCMP2712]